MSRALRRPGIRRTLAVLLTAVFLSAGTTLPGVDALLHHGGAAAQAEHQSHIEPAGGCASHADSCTLGRTATGAGAALAHAAAVRLLPAGVPAAIPAAREMVPPAPRHLLPSPRAPPPPIV